MAKFVYDKEHLRFKRVRTSVSGVIWTVVKYILASFAIAVGIYVIFALVYDTERDKTLIRENRELQAQLDQMTEKMEIISKAVDNLDMRDRSIYRDVFNTDPPQFAFGQVDTSSDFRNRYARHDKSLIEDAAQRLKVLEMNASYIEQSFALIQNRFSEDETVRSEVPCVVPLKDFNLLQTGASIGKKVNPFYKNVKEHTGIDLLAPVGTEVFCTADGVVEDIEKNKKGSGNRVVVTHGREYQTVYSHLSVISVRKGQSIKRGMVLGRVGTSGMTFAPCLHYEVLRNGAVQDPVYYFFADLSPAEYRDMLQMAATTGQSMD